MEGPRACREEEFEEVIALINSVFREGTDQDISTDYPLAFNKSQLKNMRIIKENDRVVCHVPIVPREVIASDDRFIIAIIAPTVTHPDYRRKGYGTLCLRDCIHTMEEKGYDLSVLWTEEATFPFYQKSGWEAVASQGWFYHLCLADVRLFQEQSFDVVEYDPTSEDHIDKIMQLHETEPYRIIRSPSDYRALFALPKTTTYLAMEKREIAAYLTFGEEMNKPGIIESGGKLMGLEALLRHVLLERGSAEGIDVLIPLTPSALGHLLKNKGVSEKYPIEEKEAIGYQMVRVNSLRNFLGKIKNYLVKKTVDLEGDLSLICKESGEEVTLKFNDGDVNFPAEKSQNQVLLSRCEISRLIFGPYRTMTRTKAKGGEGEILERIFPYYFPIWEIDHC